MSEEKYLSQYMGLAISDWANDGDDVSRGKNPESHIPCVSVVFNGVEFPFVWGKTPFNTNDARALIDDKNALYDRCSDVLLMPATEAFDRGSSKSTSSICDEVMVKISDEAHPFHFPLIIKPNKGSLSQQVYIASDRGVLVSAIDNVRSSASYGDVVLVQQCIETGKEYRAICLDGKCFILYQTGRLDYIGGVVDYDDVVLNEVVDQEVVSRIEKMAMYLYREHAVSYVGLDIRHDADDKLWVIEGNSAPTALFDVVHRLDGGGEALNAMIETMRQKMVAESLAVACRCDNPLLILDPFGQTA